MNYPTPTPRDMLSPEFDVEPDYQSLKDTLADWRADRAFDDVNELAHLILDDVIPPKVLAQIMRGDHDDDGVLIDSRAAWHYVRDYYRTKVTNRDCDEYLAEQAREAAEDDRNVQWDRENGR